MTKKDYENIARAVGYSLAHPCSDTCSVQNVATNLSHEFKADNANFDAGKFFIRVEFWRRVAENK